MLLQPLVGKSEVITPFKDVEREVHAQGAADEDHVASDARGDQCAAQRHGDHLGA